MQTLPEKFLQRMQERLGDEYPAFLASYKAPSYRGLRVNTLKLSPADFLELAPAEFMLGGQITEDGCSFYTEGERLGADPYHFAGLFYLQEPSAMRVGELLPKKFCRVLDLCAAPGGKTTQLAAKMQGAGILIANEIDYGRAKILSENVERMGISNCAVISASPETLAERLQGYFDLVLVDAPCSGEGMFKKEENAIPAWSEENVKMCAARQKKILDCASKMLCAGGRLIYSTCTFAEEEDEWQLRDFLKAHPDFSLQMQQKLYPHAFQGEGHFMATLSRAPSEETARIRPFCIQRNRAAEKAFSAFSADFFDGFVPDGGIHTLADGRMYLVPDGMPDLTGAHLLRLGAELGEWNGRFFKPAHALAMAFGTRARRILSLTREEAKRYLRGETFSSALEDGWAVVTVDGFPLGLGKAVGGTVKNHYPKGLRLRS